MISLEEFKTTILKEGIYADKLESILQENFSGTKLQYAKKYSTSTIDPLFEDENFARWACAHNMQWSDSNFFCSDNVGVLSNCCFNGNQEFYYYNKDGEKVLTTFKNFVESHLNKKYNDYQVTNTVNDTYILDPTTGDKKEILAVSKLPNRFNKIIKIELEDGRIFNVTPDQKFYDNNTNSLISAEEILKNPEKYDI